MTATEIPRPPWERPLSKRAARTPLSRDAIVDAALGIVDREGAGALSMRRVAVELGTGPASLYAHVNDKEELENLIIDRIAGEVPLPVPDPARWREQVKQLLTDHSVAFGRYPGAAAFAIAVSGRVIQTLAFLPWWLAHVASDGLIAPRAEPKLTG